VCKESHVLVCLRENLMPRTFPLGSSFLVHLAYPTRLMTKGPARIFVDENNLTMAGGALDLFLMI
jgi:hypothetical protein